MLKNLRLTGVFALLMSVTAWAQVGTIKGNVTTADGKAAEFVNIAVKGTGKGATTDTDGKFEIRKVTAGSYTLVASFIGFDPIEQTVEVQTDQVTNVQFTLNETSAALSEIVVRGIREGYKADVASNSLRIQSSLLETPQNIQLVTSDVLRDQQVISMSDGLIRNVSGVVRSEHWGDLYANISARGSQLQAFRNGFNVVNSYWGPLTEDMSFVDHVEFVKGPAGFMLSSGDPSGLYNVVTKKPTGITKGEAAMTVGSYGLMRASLDLDGRLSSNGKLLYRLNVSGQNKNSHRANEYNDRYANMSDVGSFYIFATDHFKEFPVEATTLPAGLPGTKINDHSIYMNISHTFNKDWRISAQVAKMIYNQEGSSMWPSDVNADGTMIRSVGIWDSKSNMTMAQVFVNGEVITGPVRHRILGGLDMARKAYMADWGQSHVLDVLGEEFDFNDPYLGVPSNGYPEFDRETPLEERAQAVGGLQDQRYSSLYVQDELGFYEGNIRLTVAGRYTDLSQSAWGGSPDKAKHFTPRVGFSASINRKLSVYALYDQAFVPQTGNMVGGGTAQPITGNNIEVGAKKDWFGGWNTTLAIYRILKNNEITADPNDPLSGESIELGQKRAQGFEFDLRGTILPGLNLIANYAYTDSRVTKVAEGVTFIEEGSVVPGFAKNTVNTWLTYKIQNGTLKGVGFSAGYTALLDRATYWEESPASGDTMDDYFKVDAGVFWEQENLKIAVNVFNVLDAYLYSGSYASNYFSVPVYSYQTEAPRNARLSISYKF